MSKINRLNPEDIEINQVIVKAVKAAMAEHSGKHIDKRFTATLAKHLPEGYYVAFYPDRTDWTGCKHYRIHITPKDHGRRQGRGSGWYASRLSDEVAVKAKNKDVDWEANLLHVINRFDVLDQYQWEANRDAYLPQFEELERQAQEIHKKALALVASIPAPKHDPLNRWSYKTDYDLVKAFPFAFQYNERSGAK